MKRPAPVRIRATRREHLPQRLLCYRLRPNQNGPAAVPKSAWGKRAAKQAAVFKGPRTPFGASVRSCRPSGQNSGERRGVRDGIRRQSFRRFSSNCIVSDKLLLPQTGVLSLGVLQSRDVAVGVLPQFKEVLECLCGVRCGTSEHIAARHPEIREGIKLPPIGMDPGRMSERDRRTDQRGFRRAFGEPKTHLSYCESSRISRPKVRKRLRRTAGPL